MELKIHLIGMQAGTAEISHAVDGNHVFFGNDKIEHVRIFCYAIRCFLTGTINLRNLYRK